MAKRTKKTTKARSLLKLEALEQRQLLAVVSGGGTELTPDLNNDGVLNVSDYIQHPNGNRYDQVLMTGTSVTVQNDAGQITRVSFLDAQGDIVQAEFSGAGSLTISMDSDGFMSGVTPTTYNQDIEYVQGLASFTIQGSDATTNFTVFSVGTATAHGGAANSIFEGGLTGGDNYANIARLTIVADPENANGSTFGGIRAGNAIFSDDNGPVGIAAANVHVQQVVTIGDINATGAGVPTLIFGENSQFAAINIAGGDLLSANSAAINNTNSYEFGLNFTAGTTSGGVLDPVEDSADQIVFTNPPEFGPLTANADQLSGTGNADVLNGVLGTDANITVFDDINFGGGTDTFNILANDDVDEIPAGVTVEAVENVNIGTTDDFEADISEWTGVTKVTLIQAGSGISTLTSAATTSVSITNEDDDITLTDEVVPTVTINDATAAVDLTVVSASTLNLNDADGAAVAIETDSEALTVNAAGAADLEVTGDVENLTLNATDDVALDVTAAGVTSLTASGSGDLEVTASDLSALESLAISGAVNFTADVSGSGDLETITSTSTGDIDLTIDAATALEVTTGAGDDTLTTASDLTEDTVFDLGAGDDALVLAAGASIDGDEDARVDGGEGTDTVSVTAAVATGGDDFSEVITGFEVLEVSSALANGTSVDVANFDDISEVVLDAGLAAAATAEVEGLESGAVITVNAAGGAATVLNLTVNDADDEDDDSITVNLLGADGADFGTIAAADVETLNLNVSSTDEDGILTVDVNDADLETLVLAQSEADEVASVVLTGAALDAVSTVDASGIGDGNVTVTFAGNTGVTYTGADGDDMVMATGAEATLDTGDGDDVVTVNDVEATVDLGAGDDTITLDDLGTVTGGSGEDAFTLTASTNGNTYSIITDIEEDETITFSTASSQNDTLGDGIELQDTAAFADFLLAATSVAAADGDGDVSWFQFAGNTYVVQDNNDEDGFTTGDAIVRLSGLIDLSESEVNATGVFTYIEA